MELIYVHFPHGSAVILNGVTVYHEDDDPGYVNRSFSAQEVARKLAKSLNIKGFTVELAMGTDLSGEDWNFDDVHREALERFKMTAAKERRPL